MLPFRCVLLAVLVPGAFALAAAPKAFPDPDAAVQALITASRSGQDSQVLAVLGSDAKKLVESGDPVADAKVHERFVALYDEGHTLVSEGDDRRVLQIGASGWPFPIPLVKGKGGWSFDTAAGKEELIARRVGQNELNAIQVCRAIADAQRDYLALNPEQARPAHYASKIVSTAGKKDGLYWATVEGQQESPLGPGVARASAEGYQLQQGKLTPYHGYYYRLLVGQGPNAEGGAVDYRVKGQLYGGWAVVAYPAEYANSGVMTFQVNHAGVVFQKDLGKDTAAIARAWKRFDPGDGWIKASTEP